MKLWDPCFMKLKNVLWCMVYCFENHLLGYLLNSKRIKIALNIYILLIRAFKTSVQVEINKVLRESGVEDRHLVAGFENNRAGWNRFERVGSRNFFRNRQISSETPETSSSCFWDPKAKLGPKSPKSPPQAPPQKWFAFRKCDERGWTSTLSTFSLKEIP